MFDCTAGGFLQGQPPAPYYCNEFRTALQPQQI